MNLFQLHNNRLAAKFSFVNQSQLAQFVLELAKKSDLEDHHADMEIFACNQLRIVWYSHEKQEVSYKDEEMAAWCEQVYLEKYY